MIAKPSFTEQELNVPVQLLENESQQLPHEIHHTDAREMRDALRRRLRTIRRLTERMRSQRALPTRVGAARG